jgi:peptide-methionine (S)-S-oxide reductase
MNTLDTLYIAGGCFWGMEELFRTQPGIINTEVGYLGGTNDHPTYRNHPGHAESLKIEYRIDQTSFQDILDYFFRIHNPTTINQQGNDKGSSYRSVIFYQNKTEKEQAEHFIEKVNASGKWKDPVVTTLEPFAHFWPAETEHQDYLQKHPGGYTCHAERFETFI